MVSARALEELRHLACGRTWLRRRQGSQGLAQHELLAAGYAQRASDPHFIEITDAGRRALAEANTGGDDA